jgi:hypothetical protein
MRLVGARVLGRQPEQPTDAKGRARQAEPLRKAEKEQAAGGYWSTTRDLS